MYKKISKIIFMVLVIFIILPKNFIYASGVANYDYTEEEKKNAGYNLYSIIQYLIQTDNLSGNDLNIHNWQYAIQQSSQYRETYLVLAKPRLNFTN